MGKLNIAHHKSYHPYRADNIARVRADEARAALEQSQASDRALVADAEARMDILRRRAGLASSDGDDGEGLPASDAAKQTSAPQASTSSDVAPSTTNGGGKHINLFEDIEQHASALSARAAQRTPAGAVSDADRGVALAPTAADRTPWYASHKGAYEPKGRDGWQMRDAARKTHADPLAAIPAHLRAARSSSSSPASSSSSRHNTNGVSSSHRTHPSSSSDPHSSDHASSSTSTALQEDTDDPLSARLTRESSERARAQALLRRKAAERARAAATASMPATPTTVHGGDYASDMYNRAEVEAAKRGRRGHGWDRERERDGRERERWREDDRRREDRRR